MENPERYFIENFKRIYQSLSKLNQLEKLWLKSVLKNGSDLVDTLKMLSECNTVNENQPKPILFPNFESLKSLRLVEPTPETMNFLHNFIASASNLHIGL